MRGRKNAFNDWLDALQASGRYTFTSLVVAQEAPSVERTAIWRVRRDDRLIQPRNGFFVIVPPEYRAVGAPPASWFIDDLMRFEKLPYYVGLLSAASLHGASPQAVQEFQIVTSKPRRPISAGRLRIRFLMRSDIAAAATADRQTHTGTMRVSTVEQTTLDLVRYPLAAGGWDNVAAVVQELAPQIDPKALARLVKKQREAAPVQRLGYLLERVAHSDEPARALRTWLNARALRYVPLERRAGAAGAPRDERWHLIVNRPIQVD